MEINEYVKSLCVRAGAAAEEMNRADGQKLNSVLDSACRLLRCECDKILSENQKDIAAAADNGVPDTMIDRLRLTRDRIEGMAASLSELIKLHSPTGDSEKFDRPNGLEITRVKVPLGVVGIIYEARPNVTLDASALCIKTGNATVLRGGKEAIFSNIALAGILRRALEENSLPADAVCLIERTEREGATALMNMRGYVDVLIPRGGKGLINSVVSNSSVPVIETGAGNCHLYVDEFADIGMAVSVAKNAKLSRPSVCNAIEGLLVHKAVAEKFLPEFYAACLEKNLEYRADECAAKYLPVCTAATDEDYYTEYNDFIISVKCVDSLDDAIRHINKYGTKHSEAIITDNAENAERFCRDVDAAAVYVNASTRFTDGGEFGFGAEIGISTQKLHARGPMGLDALTTVKYVVKGNGNIR